MSDSQARDEPSRLFLTVELATVFLLFPLFLFRVRLSFRRWIIPTLLLAAVICLVVLLRDRSFDRYRLWNSHDARARLRRTLLIFVPGGLALMLIVAVLAPDLLFQLPKSRPRLWLAVLILYPLLSVYPQEIIFRTFFFHRYRRLFPRPGLMAIASALAFGFAHLFFDNWIAPVLSTAGGLLFATTYRRSRSTLQASLEHSLWGDLIFTVGLGWYFYGGSIALMAGAGR